MVSDRYWIPLSVLEHPYFTIKLVLLVLNISAPTQKTRIKQMKLKETRGLKPFYLSLCSRSEHQTVCQSSATLETSLGWRRGGQEEFFLGDMIAGLRAPLQQADKSDSSLKGAERHAEQGDTAALNSAFYLPAGVLWISAQPLLSSGLCRRVRQRRGLCEDFVKL